MDRQERHLQTSSLRTDGEVNRQIHILIKNLFNVGAPAGVIVVGCLELLFDINRVRERGSVQRRYWWNMFFIRIGNGDDFEKGFFKTMGRYLHRAFELIIKRQALYIYDPGFP